MKILAVLVFCLFVLSGCSTSSTDVSQVDDSGVSLTVVNPDTGIQETLRFDSKREADEYMSGLYSD